MLDLSEVQKEQTRRVDTLEREVSQIYETLVLPNWNGPLHGFSETLYGLMMAVFARFDMLSGYWRGNASSKGQTARMTEFLDTFVRSSTEANSVAVRVWRHKLMHTSRPRYLLNEQTGKTYRWLLHWREHLTREQHFTFVDTGESKILNLGLMYLIEDLRTATMAYLLQLSISSELQQNYERVETELNSYNYKFHS